MADPFLAEVRMVGFNFAPTGWAQCNGQILPIVQNTAVFSLLGTTFGGDGRTTFALPNLAGRSPLGWGTGPGLSPRTLGEQGGVSSVTLLQTQLPAHTHVPMASGQPGTATSPTGATWAKAATGRQQTPMYAAPGAATAMSPSALAPVGSGQPHNNLAPYVAVNFVIALQGVFPPRS